MQRQSMNIGKLLTKKMDNGAVVQHTNTQHSLRVRVYTTIKYSGKLVRWRRRTGEEGADGARENIAIVTRKARERCKSI